MGGVAAGLLVDARAAGLEVRADGDQLVLKGPARCQSFVRRILENKASVLVALRGECESAEAQEPPVEDLASIIRRSITEPFPGVDAWVPCRGGCGTLVGAGQKCRPCAEKAVEEWVAGRKRPARVTGPHTGVDVRNTGAAATRVVKQTSTLVGASVLVDFIEPGTAEPVCPESVLTADALELLEKINAGAAVPLFMTSNLKRIAEENGVDVTDVTPDTDPNQVITALAQKSVDHAAAKPDGFGDGREHR